MVDEITERLVAAHAKLIRSFVEVRERFDAGADDWQYALLRTFREYCCAIGVDHPLLDPLQVMINSVSDEIRQGRRTGGERQSRNVGNSMAMTFAAAAVTVLHERGGYERIADVVRKVAKAAGIRHKRLSVFRDDLSRDMGRRGDSLKKVSQSARAYPGVLAQIKPWTDAQIFSALERLPAFVERPR